MNRAATDSTSMAAAASDRACAAEMPRRVLDTREAARILNVGPRLLRRMRAEGSGPVFVRLSARSIGYLPSDLEAWLTACRQHHSDGGISRPLSTLNDSAAFAAKRGGAT